VAAAHVNKQVLEKVWEWAKAGNLNFKHNTLLAQDKGGITALKRLKISM
jgi:hypothetical protein